MWTNKWQFLWRVKQSEKGPVRLGERTGTKLTYKSSSVQKPTKCSPSRRVHVAARLAREDSVASPLVRTSSLLCPRTRRSTLCKAASCLAKRGILSGNWYIPELLVDPNLATDNRTSQNALCKYNGDRQRGPPTERTQTKFANGRHQ